jgi:hypothetical protein
MKIQSFDVEAQSVVIPPEIKNELIAVITSVAIALLALASIILFFIGMFEKDHLNPYGQLQTVNNALLLRLSVFFMVCSLSLLFGTKVGWRILQILNQFFVPIMLLLVFGVCLMMVIVI